MIFFISFFMFLFHTVASTQNACFPTTFLRAAWFKGERSDSATAKPQR